MKIEGIFQYQQDDKKISFGALHVTANEQRQVTVLRGGEHVFTAPADGFVQLIESSHEQPYLYCWNGATLYRASLKEGDGLFWQGYNPTQGSWFPDRSPMPAAEHGGLITKLQTAAMEMAAKPQQEANPQKTEPIENQYPGNLTKMHQTIVLATAGYLLEGAREQLSDEQYVQCIEHALAGLSGNAITGIPEKEMLPLLTPISLIRESLSMMDKFVFFAPLPSVGDVYDYIIWLWKQEIIKLQPQREPTIDSLNVATLTEATRNRPVANGKSSASIEQLIHSGLDDLQTYYLNTVYGLWRDRNSFLLPLDGSVVPQFLLPRLQIFYGAFEPLSVQPVALEGLDALMLSFSRRVLPHGIGAVPLAGLEALRQYVLEGISPEPNNISDAVQIITQNFEAVIHLENAGIEDPWPAIRQYFEQIHDILDGKAPILAAVIRKLENPASNEPPEARWLSVFSWLSDAQLQALVQVIGISTITGWIDTLKAFNAARVWWFRSGLPEEQLIEAIGIPTFARWINTLEEMKGFPWWHFSESQTQELMKMISVETLAAELSTAEAFTAFAWVVPKMLEQQLIEAIDVKKIAQGIQSLEAFNACPWHKFSEAQQRKLITAIMDKMVEWMRDRKNFIAINGTNKLWVLTGAQLFKLASAAGFTQERPNLHLLNHPAYAKHVARVLHYYGNPEIARRYNAEQKTGEPLMGFIQRLFEAVARTGGHRIMDWKTPQGVAALVIEKINEPNVTEMELLSFLKESLSYIDAHGAWGAQPTGENVKRLMYCVDRLEAVVYPTASSEQTLSSSFSPGRL